MQPLATNSAQEVMFALSGSSTLIKPSHLRLRIQLVLDK